MEKIKPPPGKPNAAIDPSRVKPMRVLETGDRVTAKLTMYHEHLGEQPTMADVAFSQIANTQHQVYERRLEVGEEWEPLDIGWLPEGDVGYVVLDNRTGRGRTVNPTVPEKAAEAQRIVRIRLGDDGGQGWPIRPGRFFVAEAGSDTLQVRAEGEGPTRLNITIFPR